jgi:hypothetical protein
MGLIATILVGLGGLLCLVSPSWGFCAFVATAIIRPNEQFDGVMVPTAAVMILGLGAGYLLHFGRRLPRPPGGRSRATVLFVAMMMLLLVHLLTGRREGLIDWILDDLSQGILTLLYLTQHMSAPPLLERYFSTVMLSCSVVCGIPFFVHFFYKGKAVLLPRRRRGDPPVFSPLFHLYHYSESGRYRLMGKAKGMWGNSNDLGMLANWAIPCALFHLRRKGSKLLKVANLALLGMLAAVVMLTGSRGGQLNLGITLWMVFVGGKRKVLGILLLLVALAGILVVLPKLRPERTADEASSGERMALIGAGVGMFKSNPVFGVGFHRFEERSFRRLSAHNVYVQCFAETGLLGAALFLPLIVLLRRETSQGVKHFEGADDARAGLLARSIGATQLAFTVFILFSNQFMRFTFSIIQAMGIALYVAMLRDRARRAAAQAPEKAAAEAKAVPAPAAESRAPRLPPRRRALALPPHGEDADEVDDSPATPATSAPRYVFDPARPDEGVQPAGSQPRGTGANRRSSAPEELEEELPIQQRPRWDGEDEGENPPPRRRR